VPVDSARASTARLWDLYIHMLSLALSFSFASEGTREEARERENARKRGSEESERERERESARGGARARESACDQRASTQTTALHGYNEDLVITGAALFVLLLFDIL
jgi:hypothetical protein